MENFDATLYYDATKNGMRSITTKYLFKIHFAQQYPKSNFFLHVLVAAHLPLNSQMDNIFQLEFTETIWMFVCYTLIRLLSW